MGSALETSTEGSKQPTRSWDAIAHKKAGNLLFSDLIQLSREDPELFKDLYYNRVDEFGKFDSILDGELSPIRNLPNVLIVGDAGVGKSNFMYKIATDEALLQRYSLFPLVVDYHSVAPRSPTGCKLHFIDSVKKFFDEAQCPIHTLQPNVESNITDNIYRISSHLQTTPREKFKKSLVIFLDDFDYAENDWHVLLDFFRPFAASDKICLVLSIRPPLVAAIDSYDDRFRHFYLRDVQRIDLGPLNVANVLTSRLAPFLVEHKEIPFYRHIMHLFQPKSSVAKILEKLGIKEIADLPHFDYPFTQRHNTCMQRITNGNLREIFEIALESLDFVLKNWNSLETRIEDGIPRKVIGRENVLKLFCDSSGAPFRIVDLHSQRSAKGNSLLYNTIEAVRLYHRVDDRLLTALKPLGHKKDEVLWAVEFLSERSGRFITPSAIHAPEKRNILGKYPEYKLTEKGNYYLQIATWEQYVSRFGTPGDTVSEKVYA